MAKAKNLDSKKAMEDFFGTFNSAKLSEMFGKKETSALNIILSAMSLALYNGSKNNDLPELYNLVGAETFVKIATLFENRKVEFPTVEKIRDYMVLSLCYYYKEIKGLDWNEIEDILPIPINRIKYGMLVKNLNTFVRSKIEETLSQID